MSLFGELGELVTGGGVESPDMEGFDFDSSEWGQVADRQSASNQQAWANSGWANRPNQTSAEGSVTWRQDPSGAWIQDFTLSPQNTANYEHQQLNQGLLGDKITNAINAMPVNTINWEAASAMPGTAEYGNLDYSSLGGMPQQSNFGSLGGMPQASDFGSLGNMPTGQNYGELDYTGLGAMPGTSNYNGLARAPSPVDYSSLGAIPQVGQYSQQATDIYNALMAPQMQEQRDAENARLAAMGLSTGSGSAWDSGQRALNDSANQAALLGAQAGITQGNTMFGQGMQRYAQGAENLNNQFNQGMLGRQQGVSELDTIYNQLMNNRQQGATELQNQIAQSNYGKDAAFNQAMQGRQQGATELMEQFNQGMQGRTQGANELMTQFNQGMLGRQQGAQELQNQLAQANMAADQGYTQGMQNRNQGINEILMKRDANLAQLSGLMGLANPQAGTANIQAPTQIGSWSPGDLQAGARDAWDAMWQQQSASASAENATNEAGGNFLGDLVGSFFGG